MNRLFRDYNKYAENHIRSRFESDECDGKYTPAWFDLRRLQSQGDLLQLKGPPRDMDAPIILQDGTKRARKPIEKSQTLEKDARWLAHYISQSLSFDFLALSFGYRLSNLTLQGMAERAC